MKNGNLAEVSLRCLLGMLIVSAGCCINIGCWPQAKYKKTERLSAPISPGETLAAETNFGSITVSGADVTDVNITADICARAPTEQEAQELAEQVEIKLERVGKTLEVRTKKPRVGSNRSISVSFDITVPKQTSIECASSYGAIKLTNINADVSAETRYGSIKAEDIQGQVNLETSYGRINCQQITPSELIVKSNYGKIDVGCTPSAPGELNADIVTSYGSIDFVAPPEFSGEVDLRTGYGSIKTDLPITVIGEINKKRIKGTIGQGKGKLRLKTSYGSIKIR